MRMPLATHWDSMSFGFGSVTTIPVAAPANRDHIRTHEIRPRAHSGKVTAQNERVPGRRARSLVIASAASDLPEPGARVEAPGGRVVFVDLQKDGLNAQSGQSSNMQIEQAPAEPTPSLRHCHRDR